MNIPLLKHAKLPLLLALGTMTLWANPLLAQPSNNVPTTLAGPDPREIPVPEIKTSLGTLPGVGALPEHKELPDPLVMNDGTKVANVEQWKQRREEMKR